MKSLLVMFFLVNSLAYAQDRNIKCANSQYKVIIRDDVSHVLKSKGVEFSTKKMDEDWAAADGYSYYEVLANDGKESAVRQIQVMEGELFTLLNAGGEIVTYCQ